MQIKTLKEPVPGFDGTPAYATPRRHGGAGVGSAAQDGSLPAPADSEDSATPTPKPASSKKGTNLYYTVAVLCFGNVNRKTVRRAFEMFCSQR